MKSLRETADKVLVDTDVFDFLKAVYFGNCSDLIETASSRAYRDMNRTIRFNGVADNTRFELRCKVNEILKREIDELLAGNIKNQDEFDNWHKCVSEYIKQIYRKEAITLTYGQAQKWVNMTIKYLYVLGYAEFDDVFCYLHIPLDNYVFDIAKDTFGIPRPQNAWSTWDDYENQYLHYQKLIRASMSSYAPLRWEFKYWLIAMKNKK